LAQHSALNGAQSVDLRARNAPAAMARELQCKWMPPTILLCARTYKRKMLMPLIRCRHVTAALVVTFVLITKTGLSAAEPAAKAETTSYWMKKKLEHSQNMLAGIATADFDKIIENGAAMRNLSKVEGFIRGQAPGYREELQIFDKACAEIVRQARRENVEGAALAFTQLTISCVNCHQILRHPK
jgi:hypothetical protein